MWRNLEPEIVRQRLVIEGHTNDPIDKDEIKNYLKKLGGVCNMKVLMESITHLSKKFGWSGWVHWETSGTHIYVWDDKETFFSVDIYTCKKFKVKDAVEFRKRYFNCYDVVWKEF
jgi:S-adenosylmethionine/arginine decarboxylase-like enzyme